MRAASRTSVRKPLVKMVGEKGIDLGGRRRQADQVEAEAANERTSIGLGRRLELLGHEPGLDETVNFIGEVRSTAHGWQRRSRGAEDKPSALSTRLLRRSSA